MSTPVFLSTSFLTSLKIPLLFIVALLIVEDNTGFCRPIKASQKLRTLFFRSQTFRARNMLILANTNVQPHETKPELSFCARVGVMRVCLIWDCWWSFTPSPALIHHVKIKYIRRIISCHKFDIQMLYWFGPRCRWKCHQNSQPVCQILIRQLQVIKHLCFQINRNYFNIPNNRITALWWSLVINSCKL